MRQFLRNLWLTFVRGICSLGRIALLLVWGLLLALLYGQLQLATLDHLEVPDFAKVALQDRLAARGLRVDFSHARFDPVGRIELDEVSLGDPKVPGALFQARRVFTQVNPWLFLMGEYDLRELQVVEASMFRPVENQGLPFQSPALAFTAVKQVAQHLYFSVKVTQRDLLVPQLTGQVGVVAVSVRGRLRLPPSPTGPMDLKAALAAYKTLAVGLSGWEDGAYLIDPRVDIHLTPDDKTVAMADVVVDAAGWPDKAIPAGDGGDFFQCGPLHFATSLPLRAAESDPVEITGSIEHPVVPKEGYEAEGRLNFVLQGDFRRAPVGTSSLPGNTWARLDAGARSIHSRPRDLASGPMAATITIGQEGIKADASIQLADTPVRVTARTASLDSAATVTIAAPVDNALVALAGKIAGRDLGTLVHLEAPARLDVTVALTADGSLARAEGRFSAGVVRAAQVRLDAAAGHVTFDGNQVQCDEVFLQTGESYARGSYEMNTANLDYRFLLAGQAQPAAIAGWFTDWWAALWQNFSFGVPPTADLDLQGRWGAPERTMAFVAIDAPGAAVRGTEFDDVQARLFVRPGWDDVLGFSATQGPRSASGTAAMAWKAEGLLRSLVFDLTTDLDPARLTPLLGPAGADLIEPYHFTEPPRLTLSGRLEDETTAGWVHTTADLGVVATGDFAFYGFPLRDLTAHVQVRDAAVELPALAFGFAGGQVAGKAREWTDPAHGPRLAFTANLTGANLGGAIQTLENFSAAQPGPPAPAASKFQQRLATGTLNLELTAEGAPSRPLRLQGQGHASITGADLGQIQLFGLLSDMLNHTLLNFSSLSLDTMQADFTLDGEKIAFPDKLSLSGPRANLDATGEYHLDSKQLDFMVKIQPFQGNRSLFGDALNLVINPIETVLKVKLQGTLEQPDWVFVLGPTSLLRKLTGALDSSAATKK